jgi:hypothetical protein
MDSPSLRLHSARISLPAQARQHAADAPSSLEARASTRLRRLRSAPVAKAGPAGDLLDGIMLATYHINRLGKPNTRLIVVTDAESDIREVAAGELDGLGSTVRGSTCAANMDHDGARCLPACVRVCVPLAVPRAQNAA